MENGQTEILWEHLQLWERGEMKSRLKGPILASQSDSWVRAGSLNQVSEAKGWKVSLCRNLRILIV